MTRKFAKPPHKVSKHFTQTDSNSTDIGRVATRDAWAAAWTLGGNEQRYRMIEDKNRFKSILHYA